MAGGFHPPAPTLESSLSVRGEELANGIERRAYNRPPCNAGARRATISTTDAPREHRNPASETARTSEWLIDR